MYNFLGPSIIAFGIFSIIGITIGIKNKNKTLLIVSLIIFLFIALLFFAERFLIE